MASDAANVAATDEISNSEPLEIWYPPGIMCPSLVTGELEWVEVLPQRYDRISSIDLPGEIVRNLPESVNSFANVTDFIRHLKRNKVYHLVLVAPGICVIRNPSQMGARDRRFNILQTHSAIYREAKSYFTINATAYIPFSFGNSVKFIQGEPQNKHEHLGPTYEKALRAMRKIHFHERDLGVSWFKDLRYFPPPPGLVRIHSLSELRETVLASHGWLPGGVNRKITIRIDKEHIWNSAIDGFISAINNGNAAEFTVCWPPTPPGAPIPPLCDRRIQRLCKGVDLTNLKMRFLRVEDSGRWQVQASFAWSEQRDCPTPDLSSTVSGQIMDTPPQW